MTIFRFFALPIIIVVLAMHSAEIQRLRERVFELETDPHGGDLIPLAQPRDGDLRRQAGRCIVAWTVVRSAVWDPNGLMDEHMAALRKALGPNIGFRGTGVRRRCAKCVEGANKELARA